MTTLLGAAEIRALAVSLDLRPAKSLGQNFVIDANVCRKIVRLAEVSADDVAVEIGPGLGSLTLALLDEAAEVIAIEIDSRLANQLPTTITSHSSCAQKLTVINQDALRITSLPKPPTVLVANLPYNISVPVLLHFLETFPSIKSGIVMVQAEVADRLVAKPGTKDYGIPSVKAAWWSDMSHGGTISRSVFWPAPNVDSKLAKFVRREPPASEEIRKIAFAAIDAGFSQRRKMLRSALSTWLGGTKVAEEVLINAKIDPTLRGEALLIEGYCAIASTVQQMGIEF
ncbi:MAG: 16S rRNA (adenine(1518)-N(6)/adenine(1519)-N(6))-dimethyltransferase RsmA [Actinomycetota bacterium]